MARFVEVSVSYPIPHNWKWDSIGNYAKIKSGYPFDSEKFSDDPTGRQPLIRIRDILRESTNTFTDECCPEEYIIHAGDILIGMDGDFNVGKWNGDDALLNQRVCYIQSNSNCLLNDYLYYYLPGILKIINNATPSVTVKHLSANTLRKTQIPLPPLAEQQRIVDRIESLFAKLDEAKEKAQAVVDSFEARKAAILHKAFTGELTAKWREEHGVSIDNWKTTRFDSVAAIRSNLVDPAEYQSFPHIAPDNIEKKTGVLLEYHTIAEDGVTSGKHRFYSGQILYSKIRPYLSKAVVVDFDGLCSADMYPIEAYQNARCLWYYMLSDEFLLQASTAGSRSVLPKINQKELSALTVHLPTNDREQEEIARILDELFDKEQQTKEAAEVVLDQIDLMKKSILARAFRGELGTNDPSEESAVELLKQTF